MSATATTAIDSPPANRDVLVTKEQAAFICDVSPNTINIWYTTRGLFPAPARKGTLDVVNPPVEGRPLEHGEQVIACPYCDQPPGARCVERNGGVRSHSHRRRLTAAAKAGSPPNAPCLWRLGDVVDFAHCRKRASGTAAMRHEYASLAEPCGTEGN